MPDALLDLSLPLQRAAEVEHRRIDAALSRVDERLEALDIERAKLRNERTRLKERQRLLEQVIDPNAGRRSPEERSAGIVLRGARLRTEAARVLMHHAGPGQPMHYREWYRLVWDAGFIVLGKRPDATFLTAVSRSPIVRRGDEPGTYYIDPELARALSRDLAEVQAEITDIEAVLAKALDPAPHLRQHRVKLLANRRRLESHLSEAEAVLAGDARRPGHPAVRVA